MGKLILKACLLWALLFHLYAGLPAQSTGWPLNGRVTDAAGQPVAGVTVRVKGAARGTVTDAEGRFLINIQHEQEVLLFSYIGFKTKERIAGNARDMTIQLEVDTENKLNDIIVVGYGTQKKRDMTGAIGSVSAAEISQVAAGNAMQAIQGRVPGIQISSNSWRPGAGATVRIRGTRSITASNDPLYVIDGNPISRGDVTINDINPSDIASIEVLKDASATAIYGSRGANGVILITTKRGQAGKTTVEYNAYEGIQSPLRTVDVMNGGEYAEYVREAYRNNANPTYNSPVPSMEEDKKFVKFTQDPYILESVLMGYDEQGNYDPAKVRSFDWMDAVMQQGRIQSHQVSLSGGSEKTRMLFSAGYFGNKGLVKNMDYKRYNIRVNVDHAINERFKLGASSVITRANENIGSNLYALARSVNPLATPYDPSGNLVLNPGNDPLALNPLLDIDGIVNDSRKDRILLNFNLEAKIIDGLKYRANFGYDYRTARDGTFQKSMSTARSGRSDYAAYGGNYGTDIILENLLYYDKTFGAHSLGVTLLQSMQSNRFEEFKEDAEGLPYQSQEFYNLGSANKILGVGSRLSKWRMLSTMARINYGIAGRYLFTLTGRRDGSSVLAAGRKYQFFPSAAFAWRLVDENFLKGAKAVDELKLRLSYGKTGNSAIAPYQTQGNLALLRYVWDENVIIGYAPNTMPNAALSWETTAQADLGVDFGFFGNRISGAIDVYRANTSGLLMPRKLPIVSGFPEVLTNVGKTRNTGIEVSLNTINLDTKKGLKWSTGFVFSSNKEEIVELVNGKVDDVGNNWFIGQPPIGVFYDQRVIGIWQDTPEDRAEMARFNANGHNFQPGLVKVQDRNGDYKITTDDRYLLGSTRPKWTGSISSDLSFKQFDLSFQFYASWGALAHFDKGLGLDGRFNMVNVDYWTPQRPGNKYPKPSAAWIAPDYIFESYYQEASFVRLKFVTLGYTLPPSAINRLRLNRLRVYVSAQNPWLYTKFDGLDPEGATGFDAPSTRTFMVGINASL